MRLATANTFTNSTNTLASIQTELVNQQNHLSAAKRVIQASDDPLAAAAAERAMNRIARLKDQQTALNLQKDAVSTSESTLGSVTTLMQRFRDLTVSAANATNNATDRTTIANELQSVRDQVFALANTKDANGVYIFSGLQAASGNGATAPAFSTSGSPPNIQYQFNGTPGQNLPTQSAVPFTMNGQSIWMQVPKGNGAFDVTPNAANTGQFSSDIGQFSTTPPGTPLLNSYNVSFSVDNVVGSPTFGKSLMQVDTVGPPPVNVLPATVYDPASQPIKVQFNEGASQVTLNVTGTPAAGDAVTIAPYTPPNTLTLGGGNAGLTAANTNLAQLSSNPPGAALSTNYQLSFAGVAPAMTYSVNTLVPAATVASGPFVAGQAIQIPDGTSQFAFAVQGTPVAGDTVTFSPNPAANVDPSTDSLFKMMDNAINGIANQPSSSTTLQQSVATALTQIDAGINKLSAARGQAGEWLKQIDNISTSFDTQSTQLQTDLSNSQDMDMVAGLSDFQAKQTNYQVALKSYAQMQSMNLFDYLK